MGNAIHRFEDLPVWQESRRLLIRILELFKKQNTRGDFGFADQIIRASRSISANIAEGFEAETNRQFVQFLGYAKRSASEVRSHLYDALDEGKISQTTFNELAESTVLLGKMIGGFIRYLQSHPYNRRP
jgi:four helix bundle protein